MENNPNASSKTRGPVPLNKIQRRILGVLIEKALTTPEYYPLTTNALLAGCNQKSNREPIMMLETHQIDQELINLQQIGLIIKVYAATGRTERFKHTVKEFWGLERPERSALAELLLRGPQTEGEFRAHVARLTEVPTIEDARALLDKLAAIGFAKRMSPQDQKRGVLWTHLLYPPNEWGHVESKMSSYLYDQAPALPGVEPIEDPNRPQTGPIPKMDEAGTAAQQVATLDRILQLEHQMEHLTKAFDDLVAEFRELKRALGG